MAPVTNSSQSVRLNQQKDNRPNSKPSANPAVSIGIPTAIGALGGAFILARNAPLSIEVQRYHNNHTVVQVKPIKDDLLEISVVGNEKNPSYCYKMNTINGKSSENLTVKMRANTPMDFHYDEKRGLHSIDYLGEKDVWNLFLDSKKREVLKTVTRFNIEDAHALIKDGDETLKIPIALSDAITRFKVFKKDEKVFAHNALSQATTQKSLIVAGTILGGILGFFIGSGILDFQKRQKASLEKS